MTKIRAVVNDKLRRTVLPICALVLLCAGSASAQDDFEKVVRSIESRYHAHRNYRFLMAFAGMTAKIWQGSGVKDLKIALFEDQEVLQSASDSELDGLMQASGSAGWQRLVKCSSRHRDDRSYIYARTEGNDLRLLIVNVEPNEAEVLQLKLDPRKLEAFVNEHTRHGPKKSGDLAFK